eukprot:TRINITY_DN22722_c0_g1_i1.p1 TRINITY_DN22722_c0_g1~~TRINITY_DN22722_c0_g1_i1.p1  ORF type:complete len:787 (-),score=104.10 TRINITY_DN22722_c0_g1_i1:17-2377(-)
MGNAEGAVVRNVDKRTSRREHRETFIAAVARFRASPFAPPEDANKHAPSRYAHSVRVCIRKRPIFPHETDQLEFDVVTCLSKRIVIHDARMQADMIHMFMNHHDFTFDATFGDDADNDVVYQGTASESVKWAANGGSSTVMMYGQTGSGKTYTMSSIYERAGKDLFGTDTISRTITVSFIELCGDTVNDVLNHGASVSLSTASDGSVHPYPCVEVEVKDVEEFLALVDMAGKLRATAATGVNDQSSRSHAMCRAFVSGESGREGCLTLVDLAGSEHRIDSKEHNAERRKEGAKINQSLWALKECIRACASGAKFNAFRQHKLTMLLQGCFDGRKKHPTVVIATVSPSSKDTEHSLNTLRHACIMDGQGEAKCEGSEHVAGGACTREELGEIDVTAIARERIAARKKMKAEGREGSVDPPGLPAGPPLPSLDAKPIIAGPSRAALDQRCIKALPRDLRQALQDARKVSGGSEQQRRRLSRAVEKDACGAHVRVPRPSSCPPAASDVRSSEEASRDCEGQGSTDLERAINLFSLFCRNGRGGQQWKKNELRLIGSHVVPVLYGLNARIDWQHPEVALDELERLLAETPPPPHFLRGAANDQPTGKDAGGRALPPSARRQPRSPASIGDSVVPRYKRHASCEDLEEHDNAARFRSQSPVTAHRPPRVPGPIASPSSAPGPKPRSPPEEDRRRCASVPSSPRDINDVADRKPAAAKAVSARRVKIEAARRKALKAEKDKAREAGWQGVDVEPSYTPRSEAAAEPPPPPLEVDMTLPPANLDKTVLPRNWP